MSLPRGPEVTSRQNRCFPHNPRYLGNQVDIDVVMPPNLATEVTWRWFFDSVSYIVHPYSVCLKSRQWHRLARLSVSQEQQEKIMEPSQNCYYRLCDRAPVCGENRKEIISTRLSKPMGKISTWRAETRETAVQAVPKWVLLVSHWELEHTERPCFVGSSGATSLYPFHRNWWDPAIHCLLNTEPEWKLCDSAVSPQKGVIKAVFLEKLLASHMCISLLLILGENFVCQDHPSWLVPWRPNT